MSAYIIDHDSPQPSFGVLLDGLRCHFAESALFPVASNDEERKEAILAAFERGDLTDRQTATLINRFGLAAA